MIKPKRVSFRIPSRLEDYLSILSTGLHLIVSTGTLPEAPEGTRIKINLYLSPEESDRIDDIAKQYGVSRNAVIVAALVWATRANIYPTRSGSGQAKGVQPGRLSEQRPSRSRLPRRL